MAVAYKTHGERRVHLHFRQTRHGDRIHPARQGAGVFSRGQRVGRRGGLAEGWRFPLRLAARQPSLSKRPTRIFFSETTTLLEVLLPVLHRPSRGEGRRRVCRLAPARRDDPPCATNSGQRQ